MRFLRSTRSARPPAPSADGGKIESIALVTANFGGIDGVAPLPSHTAVHGFYFTDEATRAGTEAAVAATWQHFLVPDFPRHDFGPRLRGRYFKHQIHRLPSVEDYRWLAWADATVVFTTLDNLVAATRRLATLPPSSRLLLVKHPTRQTVRQEYDYIQARLDEGNPYLRLRYASEKMTEQMAYFAARGWDLEAPLWCGTLWLVENSEPIRRCWDDWWDQNLRYGMMDQLSLPMVLARHGLQPQAADFGLGDSPFFAWRHHAKLC